MECFKIEWTGSYPIGKTTANQPAASKVGVYAIIKEDDWGSKQLFYIGKAKQLGQRITQHLQELSHILTPNELAICSIFLGVIYSLDDMTNEITPGQLHDVESLLLTQLKPPGNNKATTQKYYGKPIILFNTGKLPPYKGDTLPKTMSHNAKFLKQLKEALVNGGGLF